MRSDDEPMNLSDIMRMEPDPDDLAWDHAMDISASVFKRLKDLKMTQRDLAGVMGVSPGRVSQMIKGEQGMTLKTLARLEVALGIRFDSGFRYMGQPKVPVGVSSVEIPKKPLHPDASRAS